MCIRLDIFMHSYDIIPSQKLAGESTEIFRHCYIPGQLV